MKILRIIARLNVGGPARHVVWLTEALQDEEFTSVLVAGRVPPGEEDMSYLAESHGVRPVFVEEMSRELSLMDAVSLFKILRILRRERPDIVHTHTAKAGTVGRAAAFVYRWFTPGTLIGRPREFRVVHTFHGHVFHSYYGKAKTTLFVIIEKILARLATHRIIVISDQQYREIHQTVGIGRADQFAVVPLGIDLEPFRTPLEVRGRVREEWDLEGGTLAVGFVGRLTEIKNIPLFLKAAAAYEQMNGAHLPKLHFIVAGDGHLRASLGAEAAELRLRRITFLGSREDIAEVYAGLDIVALTSLNEGTPLSLIEAMASGKPVISTLVGGVVDLLGREVERHDGFEVRERGIGVHPADADAFVRGLIYLVKDERLRVELKERGHAYVREHYGKGRLIEDVKGLYRGLHDRDAEDARAAGPA